MPRRTTMLQRAAPRSARRCRCRCRYHASAARRHGGARRRPGQHGDRKTRAPRPPQAAEKEAKARVPPAEMFKGGEYAGQFKEYDAEGVPLTMADGLPVSKGMAKKLAKAREAQAKAYEQGLASAAAAISLS